MVIDLIRSKVNEYSRKHNKNPKGVVLSEFTFNKLLYELELQDRYFEIINSDTDTILGMRITVLADTMNEQIITFSL